MFIRYGPYGPARTRTEARTERYRAARTGRITKVNQATERYPYHKPKLTLAKPKLTLVKCRRDHQGLTKVSLGLAKVSLGL